MIDDGCVRIYIFIKLEFLAVAQVYMAFLDGHSLERVTRYCVCLH